MLLGIHNAIPAVGVVTVSFGLTVGVPEVVVVRLVVMTGRELIFGRGIVIFSQLSDKSAKTKLGLADEENEETDEQDDACCEPEEAEKPPYPMPKATSNFGSVRHSLKEDSDHNANCCNNQELHHEVVEPFADFVEVPLRYGDA